MPSLLQPYCNRPRACRHLSQARAQTRWTPARKFLAVFSYRVAMARKCLMMLKKRSTRLRSHKSAKSHSRGLLRFALGPMTGSMRRT